MKELFDFLNAQNGDRLFWYGILFILSVFAITSMIENIFSSIFRYRKFKNVEKNDRRDEGEIKPQR